MGKGQTVKPAVGVGPRPTPNQDGDRRLADDDPPDREISFRYPRLPRRYWIPAALFSFVAVLFGFVHAAFPSHTAIDTTTVLLLGLGLVPFLVPVVQSFEAGPGGVKITRAEEVAKARQVLESQAHEAIAKGDQQLAETYEDAAELARRAAEIEEVDDRLIAVQFRLHERKGEEEFGTALLAHADREVADLGQHVYDPDFQMNRLAVAQQQRVDLAARLARVRAEREELEAELERLRKRRAQVLRGRQDGMPTET